MKRKAVDLASYEPKPRPKDARWIFRGFWYKLGRFGFLYVWSDDLGEWVRPGPQETADLQAHYPGAKS